MYHYVHDAAPLVDPPSVGTHGGVRGLTRAAFAEQLDTLCQHLEPIGWPNFFAGTSGRATLPRKSFLLTFDDGLADHAENVVPILQERGLRGTFFVPGAVLAQHEMLPAHAVHLLLSAMDAKTLTDELRIEVEYDADAEAIAALSDSADADADARRIYGYETPELARLKHLITWRLPIAARNRVIKRLFERHVGSSARWARHWYLGWNALADMQSLGHTIGGHGFEHEPYSRLSREECRTDASRVASVLREGLGADARPFSYPFGAATPAACEAVAHAGFVQTFTTEQAWASESRDPFLIPRVDTIAVPLNLESTTCGRT